MCGWSHRGTWLRVRIDLCSRRCCGRLATTLLLLWWSQAFAFVEGGVGDGDMDGITMGWQCDTVLCCCTPPHALFGNRQHSSWANKQLAAGLCCAFVSTITWTGGGGTGGRRCFAGWLFQGGCSLSQSLAFQDWNFRSRLLLPLRAGGFLSRFACGCGTSCPPYCIMYR